MTLNDLLDIYLHALAACAPDLLVRRVVPRDAPRNVVAIGKCAAGLLDGVAAVIDVQRAFVVVPAGYPLPRTNADVAIGGHPELTPESFDAGRRLLDFVDACDDILFLVSGGGSACVEVPLIGEPEMIEVNRALVASSLNIGEINTVRKHLSAIKGGRLAARVRGRKLTLVYSDVSRGALADVASGPTLVDATTNEEAARIAESLRLHTIVTTLRKSDWPETVKRIDANEVLLVADNDTLLGAVPAERRFTFECDVDSAARQMLDLVRPAAPSTLIAAGGEPTLERRGDGRGGRCTELAARFALAALEADFRDVDALFGTSDGVDGTSGVAAVRLRGIRDVDRNWAYEQLRRSNSLAVAEAVGEVIRIPATGNNLRDLYLLARG